MNNSWEPFQTSSDIAVNAKAETTEGTVQAVSPALWVEDKKTKPRSWMPKDDLQPHNKMFASSALVASQSALMWGSLFKPL